MFIYKGSIAVVINELKILRSIAHEIRDEENEMMKSVEPNEGLKGVGYDNFI